MSWFDHRQHTHETQTGLMKKRALSAEKFKDTSGSLHFFLLFLQVNCPGGDADSVGVQKRGYLPRRYCFRGLPASKISSHFFVCTAHTGTNRPKAKPRGVGEAAVILVLRFSIKV